MANLIDAAQSFFLHLETPQFSQLDINTNGNLWLLVAGGVAGVTLTLTLGGGGTGSNKEWVLRKEKGSLRKYARDGTSSNMIWEHAVMKEVKSRAVEIERKIQLEIKQKHAQEIKQLKCRHTVMFIDVPAGYGVVINATLVSSQQAALATLEAEQAASTLAQRECEQALCSMGEKYSSEFNPRSIQNSLHNIENMLGGLCAVLIRRDAYQKAECLDGKSPVSHSDLRLIALAVCIFDERN
jgi:hypothetical protein